jgi:hypothetical protein
MRNHLPVLIWRSTTPELPSCFELSCSRRNQDLVVSPGGGTIAGHRGRLERAKVALHEKNRQVLTDSLHRQRTNLYPYPREPSNSKRMAVEPQRKEEEEEEEEVASQHASAGHSTV